MEPQILAPRSRTLEDRDNDHGEADEDDNGRRGAEHPAQDLDMERRLVLRCVPGHEFSGTVALIEIVCSRIAARVVLAARGNMAGLASSRTSPANDEGAMMRACPLHARPTPLPALPLAETNLTKDCKSERAEAEGIEKGRE